MGTTRQAKMTKSKELDNEKAVNAIECKETEKTRDDLGSNGIGKPINYISRSTKTSVEENSAV